MSLILRKPDFCICENKGADQLRSNYAGLMVNSYFYQLVPCQLVLFHWSTHTFLQLVLWSTHTFSLVNLYFFLWSTHTFLKNYLRYAMFLYYHTPWTFNMILRLLKEHKLANILVFFMHWRVKSLLVEV